MRGLPRLGAWLVAVTVGASAACAAPPKPNQPATPVDRTAPPGRAADVLPCQTSGRPTPPRQDFPWIAPAPSTAIPEALIGAARLLFRHGLADPRGGEYREIVVVTSSVWSGNPDQTKAHGWVLPSSSSSGPRMAVTWNGLLYPVVSVGKRADLKADVLPIIA